MITQFRTLHSDLYSLVNPPEHKALSLSVMNRDVYKDNFTILHNNSGRKFYKLKLGLLSRQFKSFQVRDDKDRIGELKRRGFNPALPSISFKGRKLLLNLPFVKNDKNKESSKLAQVVSTSDIELGIDLGLKQFAVISVYDKENDKEIARYFLGARELFNMQFNSKDGNLYFQGSKKRDSLSNIKLKLLRLREQIQALQRKKNNYEQRLLERGVFNFRVKLKWNKVRRQLSLCWDRLHRINFQVVHHLNHFILQIARFWNASVIKMEDLRFATHSKQRDAGKFMAFWQTHWFYSQVQAAVKLQCNLCSIRFERVPAGYTSQICSRCGERGSRAGKIFTCPDCGFTLDSDLNASRNIVKYQR
jgi:transposase